MQIGDYLDYDGVADRVELSPGTVRQYARTGRFPPPDLRVGREPVWHVDTVDEWQDSRGD